MTKREAFKMGFLSKLASVGVSPTQFVELLEKRADFTDEYFNPVDKVVGMGSAIAKNLVLPAAALSFVGLPYMLGKITGGVHSQLTDVTPEDIERMKLQDYVETYREETEKIRNKLERDKWRKGESKVPATK